MLMTKTIKKEYLITIASVIIIIIGSIYFLKKNTAPKTFPYKTVKPQLKNLEQYVNSSGTLQAKDQINVGSLLSGKIEKIIADDNDVVKKNDVLAILDNGIGDSNVKKTKALLNESQANLKYQQSFFERQKALYKSNQISKDLFEKYDKDLQVSKAKVMQLEAELEIAEKRYENLFIKSPDDGIVIARKIDLGQMVTSQLQATTLYIIAKDLKKMEAKVDIDEADIGMIKEGQKAYFYVDAFPKKIFKAKVKEIQYQAKIIDNVVTYATILDVSNKDLKLRPGMTTNVNIKVAKEKRALVVHNKALRMDVKLIEQLAKHLDYEFEKLSTEETKSKTKIDTLWILDDRLFEKQTFRQIKVETGIVQGRHTQITNGIGESDNIVIEVVELNRKNKLLEQMAKRGSLNK